MKPGEQATIRGIDIVAVPDRQLKVPDAAQFTRCWGCAFYALPSCDGLQHHCSFDSVILMKIEDAVTYKLTGEIA